MDREVCAKLACVLSSMLIGKRIHANTHFDTHELLFCGLILVLWLDSWNQISRINYGLSARWIILLNNQFMIMGYMTLLSLSVWSTLLVQTDACLVIIFTPSLINH